jgi:hypothetical protein
MRGSATGVRVTLVPLVKFAEQVGPQLIPAGALVTVPVPPPDFVTLRGKVPTLKTAPTDWAADMVTTHDPVPEQAPLQPPKTDPAAGAAVRVTTVPALKSLEQVPGHVIPAGLLVTVPEPAPDFTTSSANTVGGAGPTLIVREQVNSSWPLVTFTEALKLPWAV